MDYVTQGSSIMHHWKPIKCQLSMSLNLVTKVFYLFENYCIIIFKLALKSHYLGPTYVSGYLS
jgi:hypothetical protein